MALPFWLSDGVLLSAQAAAVALPARRDLEWTKRLRGRGWASIPAVALVGVIVGIRATSDSAAVLADVALVAVPILAAAILGAVIAREGGRTGRAALLVLAIAAGFDMLFFAVHELPATVPVAVATVALSVSRRQRTRAPA